jgi:hypothetical protein
VSHHHSPEEDAFTARLVGNLTAAGGLTAMASTLAQMARFLVVDLTDVMNLPQEVVNIILNLTSVTVQPLTEEGGVGPDLVGRVAASATDPGTLLLSKSGWAGAQRQGMRDRTRGVASKGL